jgi:mono/diheme cytochrome c family protein
LAQARTGFVIGPYAAGFQAGGSALSRFGVGLDMNRARHAAITKNTMLMKKLLTMTIAVLGAAALSASAADAKAIYAKDCAKCHGEDGKGETKMGKKMGAKDYTDPKVQSELKDDAAFKAIKEGLKDKEGKVLMKPSEGLSDEDIKALVAYMRTFKK